MWSLESKGEKLIISRDVIFNENEFPYVSATATNPASSNKDEKAHQQDEIKTNHFIFDTKFQVEPIQESDPIQH